MEYAIGAAVLLGFYIAALLWSEEGVGEAELEARVEEAKLEALKCFPS